MILDEDQALIKKTLHGEKKAFEELMRKYEKKIFNFVIRMVRNTLGIMMPGGGYILSPTHSIQDNTPTENVLAMYESAHKFGVY